MNNIDLDIANPSRTQSLSIAEDKFRNSLNVLVDTNWQNIERARGGTDSALGALKEVKDAQWLQMLKVGKQAIPAAIEVFGTLFSAAKYVYTALELFGVLKSSEQVVLEALGEIKLEVLRTQDLVKRSEDKIVAAIADLATDVALQPFFEKARNEILECQAVIDSLPNLVADYQDAAAKGSKYANWRAKSTYYKSFLARLEAAHLRTAFDNYTKPAEFAAFKSFFSGLSVQRKFAVMARYYAAAQSRLFVLGVYGCFIDSVGFRNEYKKTLTDFDMVVASDEQFQAYYELVKTMPNELVLSVSKNSPGDSAFEAMELVDRIRYMKARAVLCMAPNGTPLTDVVNQWCSALWEGNAIRFAMYYMLSRVPSDASDLWRKCAQTLKDKCFQNKHENVLLEEVLRATDQRSHSLVYGDSWSMSKNDDKVAYVLVWHNTDDDHKPCNVYLRTDVRSQLQARRAANFDVIYYPDLGAFTLSFLVDHASPTAHKRSLWDRYYLAAYANNQREYDEGRMTAVSLELKNEVPATPPEAHRFYMLFLKGTSPDGLSDGPGYHSLLATHPDSGFLRWGLNAWCGVKPNQMELVASQPGKPCTLSLHHHGVYQWHFEAEL
ncbi:hypothetical protein WMF04_15060 [Sorangium sp. So ce260]|uniref:hypothetical protein n=1 Tax=Sorangium sp. So ce260 TaxID=3133291 RepID=UPI003F5EF662